MANLSKTSSFHDGNLHLSTEKDDKVTKKNYNIDWFYGKLNLDIFYELVEIKLI